MAQSFTPGLIRSSQQLVRKVRELPVPGTVLKKVGDSVRADEIVAKAELAGELLILRVSETLGIEPFEVVKGLKVKVGDAVGEGALLCEHAGFFGLLKSRFLCPTWGIIELISERTGHLGLRLAAKPISVSAYIEGKVVAVEKGKNLTIENQATFVQGIFGVGGEKCGKICMLNVSPEQVLGEEQIPPDCTGKVLVGGCSPSAAALQLAAQRGAVGLVTGSIDDRALASYLGYDLGIALTGDEPVSMSLILTEGFGQIPLSEKVLQLLKKHDGAECSINGATQVRAGALRPEIIISKTQAAIGSDSQQQLEKESESTGLMVGTTIRIIRVPYFGVLATVLELPEKLEKIETGAEARVLRAKIQAGPQQGKVVTLPRANVELS